MTRDTMLVGGALIAALIIGIVLYFAPLEKITIPFAISSEQKTEVLAEGTNASVSERKNYKIVSGEQLAAVWGMAYGDDAPKIPDVDFSKYHVFALFAGTKASGGYTIALEDITEMNGTRVVSIVLTEPGKECTVSQAITSPFVFVQVPLSELPIQKNERVAVAPCVSQ